MRVIVYILIALLCLSIVGSIAIAANWRIADENCKDIYELYSAAHQTACRLTEENKILQNENDSLKTKYNALLSNVSESSIISPVEQENVAEREIEALLNEIEQYNDARTAKADTKNGKIEFPKHTNMFRCEDYRKLNVKNSLQYKLQQDADVVTNKMNGIRMLIVKEEAYYCAALGGAFGYDIGDAWEVTLRNGNRFNVVLGDYKHPMNECGFENDLGDKDVNYLGDECLNVIEFIVDMDNVPIEVMAAGTMSALPTFGTLNNYGGDIVSMIYIGKVWGNDDKD